MNIYEKIDKGEEFNINENRDFFYMMMECQALCQEYNNIKATQLQDRSQKMKQILGKTGKSLLVAPPFQCAVGKNIEVGENFFVSQNCTIMDGAKVTFGDNVWLGPNCAFYTSGHSMDPQRRLAGYGYAFPINIGNNVWLGGSVLIVPGCKEGITIGDNSVIGAGSVVTKDIPPNVLAVGNPCRIIREL